jgi:hypothetical protein
MRGVVAKAIANPPAMPGSGVGRRAFSPIGERASMTTDGSGLAVERHLVGRLDTRRLAAITPTTSPMSFASSVATRWRSQPS